MTLGTPNSITKPVDTTQIPFDWYYKRQSNVATATFSSKSVVAETATKKAPFDLHYTLTQLGEYLHALASHLNQDVIAAGMDPTFHVADPKNLDWIHFLRPDLFREDGTVKLPTKGE